MVRPDFFRSNLCTRNYTYVTRDALKNGETIHVRLCRFAATFGLLVFAALSATGAHAVNTLAVVKGNQFLRCGVGESVPGFSEKGASGSYRGFNVDFCRAVAAAVLGDPGKVVYTPVSAAGRFPLLLSGKIDLLSHTTTWNLAREGGIGVVFPAIYYYDGQSFMVRRDSGVHGIDDLKGATICVEKDTTHVAQLRDAFQQRNLPHTPLVVEGAAATAAAFFEGKCRAYTGDRATLSGLRLRAPGGPDGYDILADMISREPLAPVVRRGDEQWATIVRWVLNVLIIAEYSGLTAANVRNTIDTSANLSVRRFVSDGQSVSRALGLPHDWYVRAVEAGGNYGEIFERNLGAGSPLGIDRGQNRLWSQNGLLYAPPLH